MWCVNVFYIIGPFIMFPGTIFLITRHHYLKKIFQLERQIWVYNNSNILSIEKITEI